MAAYATLPSRSSQDGAAQASPPTTPSRRSTRDEASPTSKRFRTSPPPRIATSAPSYDGVPAMRSPSPRDDERGPLSPLLMAEEFSPARGEGRMGEGSASMWQSMAALITTSVGVGTLGTPRAMALAGGSANGLLLGISSGVATAFGCVLLAHCGERAPPRSSSFAALSALSFPYFAVPVDASIALKAFGSMTSYLLVIGTLMRASLLACRV